MIKLLVFRHGETLWNREDIIQGHTDTDLSDLGREQARKLGKKLINIPIDLVISSNMKRAKETAEIVFSGRNIKTILTPDLKEFSFGKYEGKSREEMIREMGPETMDKFWSHEYLDFSFPGGEKKIDVRERAVKAVERYINDDNLKTVAVSTHGGIVRELVQYAAKEKARPLKVGNCAMFEIKIENGVWIL